MRKLVVTEFVTLDGVMEDPGGSEKTERGGWAFQFQRGSEGDKFKMDELLDSDTNLFGRITYEGFAEAWPSRTGDFADILNNIEKFVVSSTLDKADWNNTQVIKNNVLVEIKRLKDRPGKNILLAGSAQLVNTLIQNNLIDELRLMVYPVVLGKGKQLFNKGTGMHAFKLVEVRPVGNEGVIVLVYHPVDKT